MNTNEPDQSPSPVPPTTTSTAIDLRAPAGIGGWLALFAFGQALAGVLLAIRVPQTIASLSGPVWALGSELPSLRPILVLEALAGVVAPAGAAVGLVLLFRRHPSTPRFFQFFLLFLLAYNLVEFMALPAMYRELDVLVRERGGPTGDLDQEKMTAISNAGRMAGYAALWLLYWLKSRRVANTFRPRPE